MARKKRRGRPKLSPEHKRTKYEVRLSRVEKQMIRDKIGRGVNMSTWIREQIMRIVES